MIRSQLLVLCSLVAILACQTAGESAAPAVEPELGPPPPFTAEEIQRGNPPGTERTFEVVRAEGPTRLQTVRFLESTETGRASMQVMVTTVGSDEDPETVEASATWGELRSHAVFPPEKTTRVPAQWSTRAGEFEGWLYVVRDEVEGVPVVNRYWFARTEPGPPVRFETEIGGKTAMRSELIEPSRAE